METIEHELQPKSAPPFVLLTAALAVSGCALIGLSVVPEIPWLAGLGLLLLVKSGFIGRGFFIVDPNESKVMVFFGSYRGTVRANGFHWGNPLYVRQTVSLRIRNQDSDVLKVNDAAGNPVEIAAVINWQIVDTAKLQNELQDRLRVAGVEVLDTRLRRLAYAPEIAGEMLRRQQAGAIVAARHLIVEGAVGMVDHALQMLSEQNIVELDEERKAAMVSNLLVVLCSDRGAQPVVNSGSLYG